MNSVIYAVVGIVLAVLMTLGLASLKPASGDPVIQPEGEPDPGKRP